jgi:hypothetical protein
LGVYFPKIPPAKNTIPPKRVKLLNWIVR